MLMNMKELLSIAQKNKFAVGAFNIGNGELLRSVMEVAEENNSPVILEIHPDELNFETDYFIKYCIEYALRSFVPVVIHLDHGATLNQVMKAIQLGFTSVMIDGSLLKLEDNIKLTKKVVELAHLVNVSVEAEIGTIGNISNEVSGITFAKSEDVCEFVKETGVDTLAIGIGTAHGIYPKGYVPKLQLGILQKIKEKVDIPLVLHGGSSNPDSEVEKAVELGICKVNLSSDMKTAYFRKLKEVMSKNPDLYEPFDIFPDCIKEAKKVVAYKMNLFHSVGKACLYK